MTSGPAHAPARWRRSARALRNRLLPARALWRRALANELAFWEGYVATGGAAYGTEHFQRRLAADAELEEPALAACLDLLPPPWHVLDVGAGPCTVLGKVHRGHRLDIVAVDSLAPAYTELLRRHAIRPPVSTIACDAERLVERFGPDRFDVSFAKNALDHGYDPVAAVESMARVVRPGGWIVLVHGVDEAELTGYQGLHQWNLREERGRLVIWNRRERHDVSGRLAGLVETIEVTARDGDLTVRLRRRDAAGGS